MVPHTLQERGAFGLRLFRRAFAEGRIKTTVLASKVASVVFFSRVASIDLLEPSGAMTRRFLHSRTAFAYRQGVDLVWWATVGLWAVFFGIVIYCVLQPT
jgi:hypothetical protein